jgi:hypothetical protein
MVGKGHGPIPDSGGPLGSFGRNEVTVAENGMGM